MIDIKATADDAECAAKRVREAFEGLSALAAQRGVFHRTAQRLLGWWRRLRRERAARLLGVPVNVDLGSIYLNFPNGTGRGSVLINGEEWRGITGIDVRIRWDRLTEVTIIGTAGRLGPRARR